MQQSKAAYRRETRIGPGGWRCSCCAPQGSKARGIFTNQIQRRYRQGLKKLVNEELKNLDENV